MAVWVTYHLVRKQEEAIVHCLLTNVGGSDPLLLDVAAQWSRGVQSHRWFADPKRRGAVSELQFQPPNETVKDLPSVGITDTGEFIVSSAFDRLSYWRRSPEGKERDG
jgi:hypothetical protein